MDDTTSHKTTSSRRPPPKKLSEMRNELLKRVQLLDTVCSNFSDNPKKKRRVLTGMEAPSQELYSLLKPSLVVKEDNNQSNVAALIMGKRGTGKTLVVEQTLAKLQQEASRKFRIVRLNGLVIQGDDVGYAVKEIIRQLSDIALMESSTTTTTTTTSRHKDKYKDMLRLRQSSFTSNLSLLDEVLQMASVDGIAILIILDEFDALLGSSASLEPSLLLQGGVKDRQLLLYHLLDRVSTQGTYLCLVAITSHLAAVSMLEKRVKSRAEGTCKVIYLNPYPTYEKLVDILLSKFQADGGEGDGGGLEELRMTVKNIIAKPTTESTTTSANNNEQDQGRVQLIFERNYDLGKDMRWFCRVISCALSLYREDVQSLLRDNDKSSLSSNLPALSQDHFLEALVAMDASFVDNDETTNNPNTTTLSKDSSPLLNSRMQALLDLSGPQVALVLAARRILARDAHTDDSPSSSPKPLTLQRMLQEYQSYRGPHRYYDALLQKCFIQLLEVDVLRPSADHTGGGPLQYAYAQTYYSMDANTRSRMPLHFPVDINRELGEALKKDLLECSTSLREWGRRKN